jgi:hypothetical protein
LFSCDFAQLRPVSYISVDGGCGGIRSAGPLTDAPALIVVPRKSMSRKNVAVAGVIQAGNGYCPAIIRNALNRPTRAHQPIFDGSVSVVLAGVSPTEW